MGDILLDIIKLPWDGAKVLAHVVLFSSVVVGGYKIAFEKPKIYYNNNNNKVVVVSTLKQGFTPKIKDLLLSSTPIVLKYEVTKKIDGQKSKKETFYKEFKFDPFEKKYYYYNSHIDTEYMFLHINKINKEFERFFYFLCSKKELKKRKVMQIKIQVSVSLKNKVEQLEDLKLWKDKKPYILFYVKADKINGN